MSTIKADTVTTKSDDTDLTITGGGTGVPNLEAGFKVGGSAGVPTASIQDDAVTLAKMAAGTDGNLITYDASGNPAHVATGTSTHILTSNGAGAAPTFQAPAGGGAWNFISKVTASDQATVEFTTGIDSTYPLYAWVITHMRMEAAGSSTDFEMHVSNDAGSTWQTSGYSYHFSKNSMYSTSYTAIADTTGSHFPLMAVSTDDNYHWAGIVYFYNPSNTTLTKVIKVDMGWGSNNYETNGICCWAGNTQAVTGVKFELGTGDNIREGVISMYGISAS
jgi:hypothetical protein